jgi:signal transduction histidine kinase
MAMKAFLLKWVTKFYGSHLEFRVRVYNIVAGTGVILSSLMFVVGFFSNAGLADALLCLSCGVTAVALLWYSSISGRYQLCSIITVILVFLIFFTTLFFTAGSYKSGMPLVFILGLMFTVFMLEGKKLVVLLTLELVVYTSAFIFAYFHPQYVKFFDTERGIFIDTFVAFLGVGLLLSITMSLHIKLYVRQQREFEAARKQAEEYAKMKSDLFAAMSHEMRTPLTVMSTYAQYAVEQIKETGVNEQTLTDFNIISDEARRLAEMADDTLKMLMSSREAGESGGQKNGLVDICALAERVVGLLKPVAARKGRILTADIEAGIRPVTGDADALTQLLWNILQNAVIHSGGKSVALYARADGGGAVITVEDNGDGIPPEILPHIFERGVKGGAEGSGIGLNVSREIARRHGGDITIESEPGKGTRIIVSLFKTTEGKKQWLKTASS